MIGRFESGKEYMKKVELKDKLVDLLSKPLTKFAAGAYTDEIMAMFEQYLDERVGIDDADLGEKLLRAFQGAIKAQAQPKSKMNVRVACEKCKTKPYKMIRSNKNGILRLCNECSDTDDEKDFPAKLEEALREGERKLGVVYKDDTASYEADDFSAKLVKKELPKKEMAGMIESRECPACGGHPEHQERCGLQLAYRGAPIWD